MTNHGKITWIYTPEKDDSPITVMLISFEKGLTLPSYVHTYQLELLHVLKGKATFFYDWSR